MRRVAFAAIALLLIGTVIQPLLSIARTDVPVGMRLAGPTFHRSANSSINKAIQPVAAEAPLTVVRGAEGHWRIAQDANGVWWFLSPDGRREFLNTVTTVQPYQRGRSKDGPHYVSSDWSGGVTPEGDEAAWARHTLARIRSTGFKGLGAWSHPAFHALNVPITRDLNIWTWMPGHARLFYHPEWATIAEHAIQSQVAPLRDNVNLVGYYTDNELDWGDTACGPAVYFDHLSPTDPNRREVVRIIHSVWTSVEEFNHDWGATLANWDELENWPTLPQSQHRAYGRLFTAWLSHLAEDYFKLTSTLLRKHDPNHLILGVRFKGYAPTEVVRASKGYTDAQSLNYYVNDARLDLELFRMMNEQSGGQPVVISEYSFHALDGRSGNRNTVGFAAQVLDQQARADGYRLYTTRLARVPYVIGADWFQWMDEPPSGRSHDGEDVNFGIVDVDDRPYELLASSIRSTTPMLNGLHAASPKDNGDSVWRESFAAKPVIHVPYLEKPIALNGELSDWTPQSKLPNVRHSQTVGLERSRIPAPNVYLGWTEAGLYLGMEVFDNDIQGAPAKGWWWTRDNVEFWINTRAPAADQNSFDEFSHQFFFVPNDFPDKDGDGGIVGQWHRAGDALAAHLIPHPAIRDAVRVLPDRYVVEIFIPAEALHGFDPAHEAELAFNIHVRNFQHAIDYFWSAPKQNMTQLRPSTWGHAYLGRGPRVNYAAAGTEDAVPGTP